MTNDGQCLAELFWQFLSTLRWIPSGLIDLWVSQWHSRLLTTSSYNVLRGSQLHFMSLASRTYFFHKAYETLLACWWMNTERLTFCIFNYLLKYLNSYQNLLEIRFLLQDVLKRPVFLTMYWKLFYVFLHRGNSDNAIFIYLLLDFIQ